MADRQNISPDYLQMLIGRLNTHEIVASKRGRDGGYALAREPDGIVLFWMC
ncbi:Rrf2 family transcriptional regulator [uncultured Roseobacter sp.]|uniref:Rrf2 family transcriptional regulator n=1 Tax=uncultured Roseobacter sp. TaxID=114847 RepID=UPI0034556F24